VDTSKLQKAFKNFNSKKILIIGDIMIDSYLWGNVERISPEAPIPIVSITTREDRMGGAANVALNIKSLGAEPIICTVIGDDDNGDLYLDLLEKRKMTNKGVIRDKARKTSKKSRIISSNQHLLRVDDEICNPLQKKTTSELVKKIYDIITIDDIHAIIFEDYDKGVITSAFIEIITKIANDYKIPVLADPKKQNFSEYKNLSLFKPNFRELTEGLKLDIKIDCADDIFEATKTLQQSSNHELVMITLSEYGIFICDNQDYHIIPAEVRDISDVSGAGDTVISVACMCICGGLDKKHIASISNIAGGLVCEKAGVVPIDKDELLKECLNFFSL